MDPIEEVIHTSFLPSLFGRAEPLPEELKELVSLSPAQGGIGIPDLKREGASSWLNAIPIEEHGLALNKQEFRDSLCLRYDLPLPNFPSYCACGEMFTVNHALSCKKGSFVAQRHDTIRDLLITHQQSVQKCGDRATLATTRQCSI